MKNKIMFTAVAAVTIAAICLAGVLLANNEVARVDKTNRFTYTLSDGKKSYSVTVEANWDADNPPTVTLSNGSRYAVDLYFNGGSEKTVTYKIVIPKGLLDGNISLVWKYYLQDPSRYTLRSDGAFNTLEMRFDYDPHFSGNGYFEIIGTEGAK